MTRPEPAPDLAAAGRKISERRLREIVRYLASDELEGRAPGTEGSRKARAYIEDAFREMDLAPAGEDGFRQSIRTGEGTNLIGLLKGSDPIRGGEVVIVSAHYDHLGRLGDEIYHGADDNASAVAIMMEVARTAALLRPHLGRSLLFIAFDAEEPPSFMTPAMGSRYFVDHPTVPLDRVALMFGMDLMGSDPWPGWEGRLFVMGEEKCPAASAVLDSVPPVDGLLIRRLGIHMIEQIPVFGAHPFSDYDSFRNREVPFLFLTCGRSVHYHRPTDTPDTLNFAKMTHCARFLLSAASLASLSEEAFQFDREGEDHLRCAEVVQEGLDFLFGVEDPKAVFPGYSTVIWTALRWWRPKVAKILKRLRAGKTITRRQVRILESVSLAVQSLSTGSPP